MDASIAADVHWSILARFHVQTSGYTRVYCKMTVITALLWMCKGGEGQSLKLLTMKNSCFLLIVDKKIERLTLHIYILNKPENLKKIGLVFFEYLPIYFSSPIEKMLFRERRV